MRREGRQHGLVRSYGIMPKEYSPRPCTRHVNQLYSRPIAGFFAKVTSKPTNHSKFTGRCTVQRCTDCRMCPATKAKGKTKGAKKERSKLISSEDYSYDYAHDHNSYTDEGAGQYDKVITQSRRISLDDYFDHYADNHDNYTDEGVGQLDNLIAESQIVKEEIGGCEVALVIDENGKDDIVATRVKKEIGGFEVGLVMDANDKDDIDATSFCDVAMMLDGYEGDDGWFFVENI